MGIEVSTLVKWGASVCLGVDKQDIFFILRLMVTKQTSRMRRLRKEADKLWFDACLHHWGELCICGKPAVQVHHFYPKGQFGHLRYVIDNGVPICQGCHLRVTNPNFVLKVIELRGKEWHDKLFEMTKQKPASFRNVGWYQDLIEELKQ